MGEGVLVWYMCWVFFCHLTVLMLMKRDRKFKYNLLLRRVRVTIVAVEKQYIVCVCNLSYPVRKAHAACYIVTCDRYGSNMFFHLILVNDQLEALFFNVFISTPLHVSSSKCSSSGGPTCINTPSGITHSSG